MIWLWIGLTISKTPKHTSARCTHARFSCLYIPFFVSHIVHSPPVPSSAATHTQFQFCLSLYLSVVCECSLGLPSLSHRISTLCVFLSLSSSFCLSFSPSPFLPLSLFISIYLSLSAKHFGSHFLCPFMTGAINYTAQHQQKFRIILFTSTLCGNKYTPKDVKSEIYLWRSGSTDDSILMAMDYDVAVFSSKWLRNQFA